MNTTPYKFRHKAAARTGAPLIFTFHGTGGDENQFFTLAEQLMPEAGVVSPRGDVSEHGALRFFRRKAEGAYDMADLKQRTGVMAQFIEAHKVAAAPSRTIGIGYSNGANILASVALADPSLFDDIVLMHPLVIWSLADDPRLARLNALITAGRRDPICPPAITNALSEFLMRQGSKVKLDWHDGGHELRLSEQVAISRFLDRA